MARGEVQVGHVLEQVLELGPRKRSTRRPRLGWVRRARVAMRKRGSRVAQGSRGRTRRGSRAGQQAQVEGQRQLLEQRPECLRRVLLILRGRRGRSGGCGRQVGHLGWGLAAVQIRRLSTQRAHQGREEARGRNPANGVRSQFHRQNSSLAPSRPDVRSVSGGFTMAK